ncbi:MAG: hypothetical protein NT030_08365 [Candidatus Saganbacteria bacterium]|nr:hypothetical protein [Candidatus Saganbacteria bacterium]
MIRIQIDPSKVDVSLQGGPVNEAMIKESLVSILRSNPLFIDVFRGAVYSSADQSGDKGEELKSQFEIFAQALNEINEGAREIAKEEMGRRGLPISDEHIERFLSISEDCYSKTEHIFARENLEIFRAYMDTRNRLTGENGLLRSFMSELVIQRYMQLFKSSFIDKFTLMHEFIEKIRGLYRRGHENYLIEKRFVQEKLKPESVKISIEKRAEHIYEAIFSDKGETARKIEIFSNNGLHGLENRNVSGDFLAKLRDVGFNRIIINLPEAENARLNFDELSEHFRDLKAEGKIKINGCLVMSKDNGSIQYRQFELGSWNIRSDNGSFILVDGEGKPISDKAGSIKGTPLEVLKRGEEWTKVRPGTVGGAAIDFPGVRETPAPAEELRLIRLENIRSVRGDVYGDKLAEKIVSEIENPNFERIAEIEGKLRESLGRMTNEEFAKLIGEKNIKKAAEIKTKLNRYILKQGGIGLASMTFGFVGMIGLSTLLHHIDPEMNQSLHTAIVLLGGHFTNEGIMALINSYKKKGFIETLRVLKSPVRPGKILRAVGRDFYTVEKAAKQGKNVRQILRTPAKLLGGMGRGNISAAGWRAAMDTLGVSKNSKLRAYGEMGAFFAPDVIGLGNTVLDRVIGFKFLSNIGKKGIIKAGGKALGIVGAVAFTADLTVGGIEYLTVKDPYMRFVMGRAKEAWKKDQAGVFAKYGLIAGDALVGSFVDSMIPDKYLDLIEKEDGKGISDMLEDFGVGLLASILYVFGLELSIEGRLSASMLPEEAKEAFKEHIITYLTQGDGKGAEYFAYMQYVIRLKYGENIPKELKAITELNIEYINNIDLSDAFIDAILNVGTVDGKGLMGQIKKLSLKPLTRGHSV